MISQTYKAKAYLKDGCPFSFKFYLFIVEAGLTDEIEVIRCKPDTPELEEIKAKLQTALGKPATFPTVEIEPNRYQADSDKLIAHYARKHSMNAERLPALAFYKETILPQVVELHEQKEKEKK